MVGKFSKSYIEYMQGYQEKKHETQTFDAFFKERKGSNFQINLTVISTDFRGPIGRI